MDAILAFSSWEHRHLTDEAWLILSGGGTMEVEADMEKIMKFELGPGDIILIPANRHHRFICAADKRVKFLRLLPDISGWKSIYRKRKEMAPV